MKKWDVAERLGQAIRDRRRSKELSQDAFADAIGMNRAYFSAIERGEKNITMITLHRVAKGLDVPMADLLAGVDGAPTRSG